MRLTLTDVGHRFGDQPWLFEHLDLDLRSGTPSALVGPSGSGKSTLLGIIAGWLSPMTGVVSRDGITSTQWVFQSPHGVARRSVLDHAALPALARGASHEEARAAGRSLLTRFGLQHRMDARFSDLSGGEAQRLMLARAVGAQADLLLVDEPTAQLDPSTTRTVAEVIGQLAHDRTIVIVATHDTLVRDACDRVIDLGDPTSWRRS